MPSCRGPATTWITGALYLILDNLPHVHDHPRFLRQLRQRRITPAYTPTDASWLNLIEPQFGVTKRATLTDTDDPSHATRMARYIRYRNRRAGVGHHPLTHLLPIRDIKLEQH